MRGKRLPQSLQGISNTSSQNAFRRVPTVDYDYDAPCGPDEGNIPSKLARDLLDTPALRRLEGVAFLGAVGHRIAAHDQTQKVDTRYAHSVGVLMLAERYCVLNRIPSHAGSHTRGCAAT